jgi:hypothetical protein
VDPNQRYNTPCAIPRWSRVYIKYATPNHPYTGWYIAEDTGGGFRGQTPYCKIDIFLGIGEQSALGTPNPTVRMGPVDQMLTGPNGVKYQDDWPDVWVFPGERSMDLFEDNIITYLQGRPTTGRPPGEGGVMPTATEAAAEPQPGEEGYRMTHPYFSVPYSVNPSFSVDIPYDFSIYDTMPGYLNRLKRCKDDIDCIVNNVSVIEQENPGFNWLVSYGGNVLSRDDSGLPEYTAWEAYCEKSNQHAINSLAEALDSCARSQDRDCVCNYILPIISTTAADSWIATAIGVAGVPIFGASSILGILFFNSLLTDDAAWGSRTFGFFKQGNGLRIGMLSVTGEDGNILPNIQTEYQLVQNAHLKDISSELRGENARQLAYSMDDENIIIDIIKDARNNMTLRSHVEDDMPQCAVHNKLVKFCVIQNKSFMAYNNADNKMGIQQLVLRFAYLFRSQVTDVEDFEVLDAPFASNRSILMWNPVTGVDVNYYTIYSSENAAMSTNLQGQAPNSIPEEVRQDLQSFQLDPAGKESIQLSIASLLRPECIVYDRQCSLNYRLESAIGDAEQSWVLNDDTLYYSVPDEKFFYIISNVKNDQSYFYGITATDTNGDESPSFNMPAQMSNQRSVDDVPPALAVIRNVMTDGEEVIFSIELINHNIDGSQMDPALVTGYKLYCFESLGGEESVSLAGKDAMSEDRVESMRDGTLQFSRHISDFTDFACGFTQTPKVARFVVAGLKTRQGIQVPLNYNITEGALSSAYLNVPTE